MDKRNMKDNFRDDLEAYFNQEEIKEADEFLEIVKVLENKDFSQNSNKEEVFARTLENINKYKGENNMKKSNKFKSPIVKVASLALVTVLSISLAQTSFAQDLAGRVLRTISLGHIDIVVYDEEFEEKDSYPVSDELKGKIFDKDGNPIKEITKENSNNIYTADGEEIAYFDFETGKAITMAESEKQEKEQTLIVKNPSEFNSYTCFDVILPSYLPEGYSLDKAEFYKDENGIVEDSKYISLYFTNEKTGKYIYMQQRFADEETAYETGGSKVEEIKVNGVDAVIYSDRNMAWETNGVLYSLSGRGEVSKDELTKIAESIK